MAMIGEELMALLGMIPVRDQAGIPRGNLAQETAANAARMQTASLEPQPDQMPVRGLPLRPQTIPLPAGVPVPPRPAPAPVRDPETTGSVAPLPNSPLPEPDEARTIATAPSNAMTQLDGQIARREQMGQMNSVLSGLQLLANSFNRNPDSAAAIRTSAMEGLGGGMDVKDITDIYKTRELLLKSEEDRQEKARALASRENRIKSYMRQFNADREYATAKVDSEVDKADMGQAAIASRDLAKKNNVERERILADPELINELAQQNGVSPALMRAHLGSGGNVVDMDKLSEIALRRSQTAKVGVDAAKTAQEAQETHIAAVNRADVRTNPEKYVELYKGVTAPQLKQFAQSDKSWEEFQKGQVPSLDALQQQYWTTYVPQAGKDAKSFDEWKKEQTKAGVTPPEDTLRTAAVRTANEEMSKSEQKARAASVALAERHRQQELWTPTLKSGGYGAENQENLRLTMARLFNRPDEEASDSKVFFSALKRSMQASGKNQAGPLSDKDITFLGDLEGGRALDAKGIRNLQIIHEKALRYDMQEHNQYYDDKTSKPALAVLKDFYNRQELPGPGRFIKEDLATSPEAIAALMKNPTPKEIRDFNKEFGHGNAEWIIAHDGKLE